ISLSSWLRDYLFIPLGGSRGSSWVVCRNLMITMALGGLWHGASWNFVVWGVLHGALLIVHRGFRAFAEKRPSFDALLTTAAGTFLRCALTVLTVGIGWVFFRAQSFETAAEVLRRLVVPCDGNGSPMHAIGLSLTLVGVALCHLVGRFGWWDVWMVRLPAPVVGFSYSLALTLALMLAPATGKAFIYFQF